MSSSATSALDQIKSAMAATNEIFNSQVFGQRNFDALEHVYTASASILPPGAPIISGRPAIKEFWANMIQSANALSAVLSSIEVTPTGDGIVEIGRAVLTVQPDSSTTAEVEVKYVVFWREEDGAWKWHIDIWNQNS